MTTSVQEPHYKLGLGGQERPRGRVGSVNIVTPWSLHVWSLVMVMVMVAAMLWCEVATKRMDM